MTNQNAHIGMDVERLFKNSIGHHPDVLDALKRHFGIKGDFAKAFSTGTDSGKSDVIVRFTDATLSANIKAYKTGFNQLTRITISSFCNEFGLGHLKQLFEEGAIRVAGRRGRFILESDENRIIAELAPLAKSITQFSLARNENPELLVLYNRENTTMNLYDLKAVIQSLDYTLTISSRGVIKIGRYITIQRKGGNGVHSEGVKFSYTKKSLSSPFSFSL